ncbi:hypothetical protein [Mycoplasma leonicaptivi]|uniref:hypothetical protein n=1 Tax=Mycoplasma leonicaptivi TaxID=36742 RepID=UPI0005627E1F|nr:hypothetical protein [Mycoplasma leonicaptivi]
MTIRKNITLKQEDYDLISNFISKKGYNFSEFLRETALQRIKQEEETSLLDFLNSNISSLSKEEQLEIDNKNIDFSDISAVELKLEDVL